MTLANDALINKSKKSIERLLKEFQAELNRHNNLCDTNIGFVGVLVNDFEKRDFDVMTHYENPIITFQSLCYAKDIVMESFMQDMEDEQISIDRKMLDKKSKINTLRTISGKKQKRKSKTKGE